MPSVYLSPSLQDHHIYVSGAGNEEYYMNRIADAMAPLLREKGISFARNSPYDTLPQIIARFQRGKSGSSSRSPFQLSA